MKIITTTLFLFFLYNVSKSQSLLFKDDTTNHFKFEVFNFDTLPTFNRQDPFKIQADLIFPNLSSKLDTNLLKPKINSIIDFYNLDQVLVFRNKMSSSLYRMSSMHADSLLKAQDGFIGKFKK